jgi:hypothetical protein
MIEDDKDFEARFEAWFLETIVKPQQEEDDEE